MSGAVETIFADRAWSCIFVHRLSQLRGAVETIFSNRDISGHFGACPSSNPIQLVKEQPAGWALPTTTAEVGNAHPTNNGRAARQGCQWRNMFFENGVSKLKASKKILFQRRFLILARCALRRALRSAPLRNREGAKGAKKAAKIGPAGLSFAFVFALFAPSWLNCFSG